MALTLTRALRAIARAARGHQRCFAAARAACVSTWLGEGWPLTWKMEMPRFELLGRQFEPIRRKLTRTPLQSKPTHIKWVTSPVTNTFTSSAVTQPNDQETVIEGSMRRVSRCQLKDLKSSRPGSPLPYAHGPSRAASLMLP